MKTQDAYETIMASEVFRLDGPKIDLPQALIDLCDAINTEDETDWNMGEFEQASLSDLITGAYWSLTEWHAGQYDITYAALSQLGTIFSPGMTSPPTEDMCGEYCAYELCNAWFEANSKATKAA
jgi:hypothetical protein